MNAAITMQFPVLMLAIKSVLIYFDEKLLLEGVQKSTGVGVTITYCTVADVICKLYKLWDILVS